MRIIVLLQVLLLSAVLCTAQTNYKEGYVITDRGDTLRGLVSEKEWRQNPEYIFLKQNGVDKKLYVAEIRYFSIGTSVAYERFTITASMNEEQLSKLSIGPDTSKREVVALLRVIAQGKNVSFFEYTDQLKTRYYIKEAQEQAPRELLKSSYRDPETDNTVIASTEYVTQLQILRNKYAPSSRELERRFQRTLRYSQSELLPVIFLINGGEAADAHIRSEKRDVINLFAGIRLNKTGINYNGTHELAADNAVRKFSYLPGLSVGLDGHTNKQVYRMFYRLELNVAMANNLSISAPGTTYLGGTKEQRLKIFTTSFTPQVYWNIYNAVKLKWFLGGGVGLNLASYSDNKLVLIKSDGTREDVQEQPKLESFFLSFPLKTGVLLYNKAELSASYAPRSGIADYMNYNIWVQTVSLSFNYFFTR